VSAVAPFLNQIILGDCLKVLRRLPDDSVDFILTDPPYLARFRDRTGRCVANDDNSRWLYPAFAELHRVLKPNRFGVSFYGWPHADRFVAVWRECGLRPIGHLVWIKRYASRVRYLQMRHEQAYLLAKGNPPPPKYPPPDVLPWHYSGNRLHPTQKPVGTLTLLIEAFSQPDDVVLDPFGGSGTTAIAARQCGRRFILIEQDAAYHRAASERLH
jgi:site-specific DNA-methyltransferase (adenine-specific)